MWKSVRGECDGSGVEEWRVEEWRVEEWQRGAVAVSGEWRRTQLKAPVDCDCGRARIYISFNCAL